MMIDRKCFLKTLAAAGLALAAVPAFAQTPWPSRPIRFVVPYPPGGPTDLMARMISQELTKRLHVTVVVDNRSGAGGNIGSAEVARNAPADGYTLLLAASGPMAVNPTLYKSMPFDPLKDLAPVIQISSFPLVLEANPGVGVKTVQDLVAMAHRGDSNLTFASAGNGTPQHLAGEIFNTQMKTKITHVPYRGAGPALNDLMGGQVKVMFDILASSLPYLQNGRLVPLAVTSAKRVPALPNVPTMEEAGVPGYEFTAWHGIAVRSGTPAAIIGKLNATLNAIFQEPEFRKKWEAIGTPVVGGTPEQFGDLVRRESVRLGEVVRKAGITVD
ncbi:MAG: tripartite tricarboxylate transporter substrate binding protein [Burkholderiales bacterium]|nr:tripartite tricarboxylate transporter substrate binding protein [Burkholderiales bacterium]